MFLAKKKKKNNLVSLEKCSTFADAFTVFKFCNNPIQVEKGDKKLVCLACFLKRVFQNGKCLTSKINSSVNSAHVKQKWSIF